MEKSFYSEIGKIGALKNRENRIMEYNNNPNYCMYCGNKIEIRDGEIPSQTRKRVFCCKECQSEYQRRKMIGNNIRKKIKDIVYFVKKY